MAFTCLYAILTMSGHAPAEMANSAMGALLLDLYQGIIELLESL